MAYPPSPAVSLEVPGVANLRLRHGDPAFSTPFDSQMRNAACAWQVPLSRSASARRLSDAQRSASARRLSDAAGRSGASTPRQRSVRGVQSGMSTDGSCANSERGCLDQKWFVEGALRGHLHRVPEHLLSRIELLQERNKKLQMQQDMMLHLAGVQRGLSSGSTARPWHRDDVACSTDGDVSFNPLGPSRLEPDDVATGEHSGRFNRLLAGAAGVVPEKDSGVWPSHARGSFVSNDTPLSQQLRQYHQLLARHAKLSAEDVIEDALKQRVLQPMNRLQRALETVKSEQRRMKREHRRQLKYLEAEGAKQEELYREQVLKLEEAMLEQSVSREQELAGQLQELEREWEELEAADAKVRLQAAQVWEQTVALAAKREKAVEEGEASGCDARHGNMVNGVSASPRSRPSMMSAQGLPLPGSAPGRRSAAQSSSGDSHAETPASPRFASQAQRLGTAASPDLVVPPGLPQVYEAAVSLVLEHGWDALHGGDNSGPAWTALHWAALKGRTDVCEVLLQAKADPCHVDEMGKTPLDYAVASGMQASAALLQNSQNVWRQQWPGVSQRRLPGTGAPMGFSASGVHGTAPPWSSCVSLFPGAHGSLWADAEQRV